MPETAIEWCDFSMNPWVGCQKISPACDNCYAESWAKRSGQDALWKGERRRTTEAYWRQPLKWNAKAAAEGRRYRVFCASLADVFDNQVPMEWRADLFALIKATPYLDWLLLTKRPQNIVKMLPTDWDGGWDNVWLGTTIENRSEAEKRIPHLLAVPARVHFLSCEPLLGQLHLGNLRIGLNTAMHQMSLLRAHHDHIDALHYLHWIICGGESGPGARPMHPQWARDLRDDCAQRRVPFLFKQWGDWVSVSEVEGEGPHHQFPDGATARRLGKKKAGRTLDGRTHDEYPGA